MPGPRCAGAGRPAMPSWLSGSQAVFVAIPSYFTFPKVVPPACPGRWQDSRKRSCVRRRGLLSRKLLAEHQLQTGAWHISCNPGGANDAFPVNRRLETRGRRSRWLRKIADSRRWTGTSSVRLLARVARPPIRRGPRTNGPARKRARRDAREGWQVTGVGNSRISRHPRRQLTRPQVAASGPTSTFGSGNLRPAAAIQSGCRALVESFLA